MPTIATLFGSLMTLLGVVLYVLTSAPTALIPAAFGVPLTVLGAIAKRASERGRMHMMHAAAMIGLIGAIGSIVMVTRALMAPPIERPMAVAGQAILGLLCATFVGFCVNSFIAARRARREREGTQSPQ